MKKIGLSVLIGMLLIIAAVSLGYAASAEEMAKAASGGTRFVDREVIDGKPHVIVIYIRGDEFIYREEGPAAMNGVIGPPEQVVSKYMQGNDVIFETQLGQQSTQRYTLRGIAAKIT